MRPHAPLLYKPASIRPVLDKQRRRACRAPPSTHRHGAAPSTCHPSMQMAGTLERYDASDEFFSSRLVFMSGDASARKFVVNMGAMTSGILPAAGYEDKVLALLGGTEWGLAQAQLRTCYLVRWPLPCSHTSADEACPCCLHTQRS